MTTPADALNSAAQARAAAQAEVQRLETTRERIAREHAVASEAVDRALREQNDAIQRSLHDESVVVPEVNTAARDLAARKLAAADKALGEARAAVAVAAAQVTKAQADFEVAHALELAEQVRQHLSAAKTLAALLSLQHSDKVREVLHGQGFRIARDLNGNVQATFPGPSKLPSLATTLACAISPKAHPAAASHLRSLVEAENAAAERLREIRRTDIDQAEARTLRELEESHTRAVSNADLAGKVALAAKHLIDQRRVQSEYAARRAAV